MFSSKPGGPHKLLLIFHREGNQWFWWLERYPNFKKPSFGDGPIPTGPQNREMNSNSPPILVLTTRFLNRIYFGPIPDLFFERLTCTGDYRSTGAIFDFRMIWRLAPWRPQFYCTRQIWRLLHCVCPKLDRNIAETQNSSRSETDGSGPFILRETVCTVPTSHGMCQSLASR
jgi:hypothetical protein